MANASLDGNGRQTIIATLNTNGVSLVRPVADPVTGALSVTASTGGSVTPLSFSATDDNERVALFAVSENDGVTPVAIQCTAGGAILIKEI